MNTKKKSMLLGTLFLVAILLGSILVSKAYVVLGTVSPSNSSLSPSVAEDKQLVFQYLIGTARTPSFKRGEKVLIRFWNFEDSPVELPNDAPWWVETNTTIGWVEIYTAPHNDTKIIVYPQEYRGTTKTTDVYWFWNLTFSNGSLLPEGYYRIVLPTNRCIYYQEFIISDTYGKLGWYIIDDILNSSVSMNKTYDVVLYLRTKNVTSDLIDYLHMEIGNFSVKSVMNSSMVSSSYNYSVLSTTLQKYQILKAIHLSVVDLIVLEREVHALISENDNADNQSEDNRIFEYSIYLGLTMLCVFFINIYVHQRRKHNSKAKPRTKIQ